MTSMFLILETKKMKYSEKNHLNLAASAVLIVQWA